MSFRTDIQKLAYRAGGGYKTLEARQSHAGKFADFLKTQNIRIEKVENVKAKYLAAFAASRLAAGISKRAIQNEMSSLRGVLREAGRHQLAALPEISNKNLGISGASRKGNKTALSGERQRELSENIRDPGVKACTWLQRSLGLRADEARQANVSMLRQWVRELEGGKPVHVWKGTKGGRPRFVNVSDRVTAVAAVKSALRVAMATQKGVLIEGTLKQARTKYGNEMYRAGFRGAESSHALRYAFARSQFESYMAAGHEKNAALAMVSMDLGHGDGRGRWIAQVYLR